MERRLTEEQTTKSILRWLINNGWNIIAFDFPQSGTGRCFHPKNTDSKTEGIWIPDIVAHKGTNILFFENKDRCVLKDFEKVSNLKSTDSYLDAINEITRGHAYTSIYYGIGFPLNEKEIEKAFENISDIDFLVCAVDEDNAIAVYDPNSIFSVDNI